MAASKTFQTRWLWPKVGRGSCREAFQAFEAWQTAASKASKTRWLWLTWVLAAAGKLFRHLRVGKWHFRKLVNSYTKPKYHTWQLHRNLGSARKLADGSLVALVRPSPDGCGPSSQDFQAFEAWQKAASKASGMALAQMNLGSCRELFQAFEA